MPQLTEEDNRNAIGIGWFIDQYRRDTEDDEALTTLQLDDLRGQLDDSGVGEILQHHFLFPDEEIDVFVAMIFEKSSAAGEEWKSISRVLYYEYMCKIKTPSAECIRALDLS